MATVSAHLIASGTRARSLIPSCRKFLEMNKFSSEIQGNSVSKGHIRYVSNGTLVSIFSAANVSWDSSFLRLKGGKVKYLSSSVLPAKGMCTKENEGTKSTKRKRYTAEVRMDFYYDTISPYSWIAFELLQRYKPVWNLAINYKPVFMAGLTKENNNKYLESLTSVPNKSSYIFQDIERTAAYYKVPVRMPESPFYLLGVAGSLKQQRFLSAVKLNYPEYLVACSRQFWFRCWSEDMDATQEQSFYIIGSRAGMTEEQISNCLQAMQKEDVKSILKETTSEAVEVGAFGLPFIVIDKGKDHLGIENEVFFGSDRFEVIANCLGVEWLGPVPDPETFTPLAMAPDYTQKELFEELEHLGHIKTDFSLPEDTPTSQPKIINPNPKPKAL